MSEKERPPEQEAVMTTIVGGRPPGSGKPVGPIPRGIEVLVKKASVDPVFKKLLIEKRADAATDIDLTLDPAEVAMISAVPAPQLEAIIANTTVNPKQRTAFLGRVAAVMIVALGASTIGCRDKEEREPTEGVRPDRPETEETESEESSDERPTRPISFGLEPDDPRGGE